MPKGHDLTHMLANLWNKIKWDSSAQTLHISKEDIVVLYVQAVQDVVGPTGSGKSWFTKEATKSPLVKVSKNVHPCTSKVLAIRCVLSDEAQTELQEGIKGVVFVDTPSFRTGRRSPDAQKELGTWLDQTIYEPRDVGVIYMHRAETDPALERVQDHLQEFATILRIGVHLPQRVHIVVSYDKTSSNVPESKIEERRSTLCTLMDSINGPRWRPSIHQERFQGDPKVAWRAVEEVFKN